MMDAFSDDALGADCGGEVVSTDEVNLDLDRAGSPVQHRRNRLRGPPPGLAEEEAASGVSSMLPPPAMVASSAPHRASASDGGASATGDEDIAFSLRASSDDDDEDDDAIEAGKKRNRGQTGNGGANGEASHGRRSHARSSSSGEEVKDIADTSLPASLAEVTMLTAGHDLTHAGDANRSNDAVRVCTRAPIGSAYNSVMSVSELDNGVTVVRSLAQTTLGRFGEDQQETPSCDGAASPAPVTVLGVAQDLRRKRAKKVSHYILGPLLGEGAFGVVRDAINVSADQKRFSRCAIKMVAGGVSSSGLANAGMDSAQDGLGGGGGGGAGRRRGGRRGLGARPVSQNEVSVVEPGSGVADGGAGVDDTRNAGATSGDGGADADEEGRPPRLAPWNGRGLVRGRDARKAQEARTFQNEINNLQRFHCKNVIRAIDVFSRYGKEYVVMPIAICSLQQFVRESIRLMREQDAFDRAQAAHDDATPTPHSVGPLSLLAPQTPPLLSALAGHEEGRRAPEASASSSTFVAVSGTVSASPSLPVPDTETQVMSLSAHTAAAAAAAAAVTPSPIGATLASRLVQEEWNPAQHYLRDGALFSPILTKGFLYQLLAGVEYLHQQRIAHNDIKPSNLLLFEDGSVKLTDLGSVGVSYEGQGTPLYASPELCKLYYGMRDDDDDKDNDDGDDSDSRERAAAKSPSRTPPAKPPQEEAAEGEESDDPQAGVVDPFANDMWGCGLVLYYLITGRPGPLPVHAVYHRYHEANRQMEEEGALHPSFHMTRWSLYREIASQKRPVNLDDVPDLLIESGHHSTNNNSNNSNNNGSSAPAGEQDTAQGQDAGASGDKSGSFSQGAYPPNGARDLLARLLEIDPAKRITAEAALQHPWVRMTFKPSKKKKEEKAQQAAAAAAASAVDDDANNADGAVSSDHAPEGGSTATPLKKPPSKRAMEDAIQRDVARRVLQSRHVKAMTLLDRQRHLQFAADCCQILGVPLPREILRDRGTEPYEDEAQLDVAVLPVATARTPSDASSRSHSHNGVVAVPPYGAPDIMPEGCVDTSLFLPPEEYDYYEQKSGKNEFDVVVLRNQPMKVRQMEEYLHNVVLVQCGYRLKEDPAFAVQGRGHGSAAKASASSKSVGASTPSTGSSSNTLVIRPGGSSAYSGTGINGGHTSVFSTNSHALTQLQLQQQQQQQQQQQRSRAEPVAVAKGVVAREESSQESLPATPVTAAEMALLPAVSVRPRDSGVAGRVVSTDSLASTNTADAANNSNNNNGSRTPAQRARQSARLSQAEAALAAQEGRTAIKESSKCLCGLM